MQERLKPTLWRTCRALASKQRLNLIRLLDEHEELTVSQAANKTGRPLSGVSEDLRILNARGLLKVRRKGLYVHYRIGADSSISGADTLVKALKDLLHAAPDRQAAALKALTGFTHVRRHKIIYELHQAPASFGQLVLRCHISAPSLKRHIRKLRDRGFVKLEKHIYHLATPTDPLRRYLLSAASKPP